MPSQKHARGIDSAQVLKAAAQEFAECGYHAATMRAIARRLGCTPGTLYYHAENKEDLLFKISHEAFHKVLKALEPTAFRLLVPADQLRFVIHNHLRLFAENIHTMKVLAHDASYLGEPQAGEIRNMKRRYVSLVTSILAKLQPADYRISDEALRWSALSLFGMMNWIYTWFKPGDLDKVDQYAEQVYYTFLDGFFRLKANQQRFRPMLNMDD